MKLILLTNEEFFVEEDKIISSLFNEGLDILHLRKPGSDPIYCERLLTLLPDDCHKQIVIHDHFYLKEEFDLKGIHLNSRCPSPPTGFHGHISKSLHGLQETADEKKLFNYVFLSPVFDSISKSGYQSAYEKKQLIQAHKEGIIDHKVMALGGISLKNISEVKEMGFGGVVIKGDLWNRFNIHANKDFKELISHFRLLKKATE